GDGRELADLPPHPQLLGEHLRACRHWTSTVRCDRRLQVLSSGSSGVGEPREGPVERLRLPDRGELQGLEARLSAKGASDRVRGQNGRRIQNVEEDRPRGGVDGVAAPLAGDYGEAVSEQRATGQPPATTGLHGRRFWKLSGSGNDFVVFDVRDRPDEAAELGSREVVRRLCARGTGVGADGVVLLDVPDEW